jgi:hypothetical protein
MGGDYRLEEVLNQIVEMVEITLLFFGFRGV